MQRHLIALGNFGQLALKVTNVGLEIITLPHFNKEEAVVILLGLSAGGILVEKCLGYLLETME